MSEAETAHGTVVLTGDQISRALVRIAHEVLEKNRGQARLAVVGIRTRGAWLGARVHKLLREIGGRDCPSGDLDISPHRDDVAAHGSARTALRGAPVSAGPSGLDLALEGATVVLVDDVLSTGRTARAAIEGLFDHGRPARVQLAFLVDRGHRELPIRPDYVGKNIPTAPSERVNVRVRGCDGVDEVVLVPAVAGRWRGV
jgi:pyrimidine operon attenuation protein / uracil phosphoribosyltransferase